MLAVAEAAERAAAGAGARERTTSPGIPIWHGNETGVNASAVESNMQPIRTRRVKMPRMAKVEIAQRYSSRLIGCG